MPRVRRRGPARRGPDLASLPDSDLIEVTVRAPGMLTTSDAREPWQATPRHGMEAGRILGERGYWAHPHRTHRRD